MFNRIENARPAYGEPVILRINGVVQNYTYNMDGADDCDDWLEPFGQLIDEDDKREVSFFIHTEKKVEWIYLKDLSNV